jgi:hypothetical protein
LVDEELRAPGGLASTDGYLRRATGNVRKRRAATAPEPVDARLAVRCVVQMGVSRAVVRADVEIRRVRLEQPVDRIERGAVRDRRDGIRQVAEQRRQLVRAGRVHVMVGEHLPADTNEALRRASVDHVNGEPRQVTDVVLVTHLTTYLPSCIVGAMNLDVTYALQYAGHWDAALASAPTLARRAEILTDRHLWRLDPPENAFAAIDEIDPVDPALTVLLRSQLIYWHQLFKLGSPDAYGDHDPVDGFAQAAKDPRLAGWATFWHAVAVENLRQDPAGAGPCYERARQAAIKTEDRLLESYAIRHQGVQLLAEDRTGGIHLLRRSLQLRAACGARPQVIAAQMALADVLGGGPEADDLREIASAAAVQLGLTLFLPEPDSV